MGDDVLVSTLNQLFTKVNSLCQQSHNDTQKLADKLDLIENRFGGIATEVAVTNEKILVVDNCLKKHIEECQTKEKRNFWSDNEAQDRQMEWKSTLLKAGVIVFTSVVSSTVTLIGAGII